MSKKRARSQESVTDAARAPRVSAVRRWPYVAITVLLITNVATWHLGQRQTPPGPPTSVNAPGPLKAFSVVNAHEHLLSREQLPKYLEAAAKVGFVRTLFVASSKYTLLGTGQSAQEGNDENSNEILEAARQNPGKIIPFCTIHPADPAKLDKLKGFVAAGAKGLKLYTGHGNFYERPLDAEDMLPVYAYCQELKLPICWHVNLTKYLDEFERVMKRYPNQVVIVPHFGVTFFRPQEQAFRDLQRLLDTYPNLYTDTSFGTREILVQGLEAVSRDPGPFKAFFAKYSDRVLFGTDMVITGNREKTPEWIEAVLRTCRDMLEKDAYFCFMGARGSAYASKNAQNTYGFYRGLNLDDATLKKVYETNFERLFPAQ